MDGTPDSTNDFAGFSFSYNSATHHLNLDKLSFDLAAASDTGGGLNVDYEIFARKNADPFASFGGLKAGPSVSAAGSGKGWDSGVFEQDLSSLGEINSGDTVEVRIGLGENSGSGAKGAFIQGIQLEGVTAIPEPSSTMLVLLAGGSFILRRRR